MIGRRHRVLVLVLVLSSCVARSPARITTTALNLQAFGASASMQRPWIESGAAGLDCVHSFGLLFQAFGPGPAIRPWTLEV